MGYTITAEDIDFTIPGNRVQEAYEAMCALNVTHDAQKTGGSWHGGKQISKHFAWMDADYPSTCKTAKDVLEHVGFDVDEDDDGTLRLTWFDRKSGQEHLFIEAAGRFALPNWRINWLGEDGERWTQTGEGVEAMANNVTVSEVSQMRALLSRAIFTHENDAIEAGKILGIKDLFGLTRPGSSLPVVTGLDERSIDSLRKMVVGR